MLHTCAGISDHEYSWAIRFQSWGYVVLVVDSLTPRGLDYICDGRSGSPAPWLRALDAFGARQYLSDMDGVDGSRIAIIGMSHGAMALLDAVRSSSVSDGQLPAFQAAVGFYPLCGQPETIHTPTLVLIGEQDSWTPANQCQELADGVADESKLSLKVFPGAHHLFDHPGIDMRELGHVIRSDESATAQSVIMTREFLKQHLDH